MAETLSVVINTKNAADTLERTLKSVAHADEIIVVDMHSSDDTLKIARKYTDRVFSHKDVGYVEPARNFAVSKASCDWVLVLDADEVLPAALWQQLPELLAREEVAAYELPRKNMIFGKWLENTGWWPDYQARLFRRASTTWSDSIHEPPQVHGKLVQLPADRAAAIEHYNYHSVSQFLEKLDRYTSITAVDAPSATVKSADLIQTFSAELLRRLFAARGIDEGVHGVALAYLQSMYQLVTQLKIWEKSGSSPTTNDQAEVIAALSQSTSDLRYWIADWHVQNTSGVSRFVWQIRRKMRW